MSSSVAFTSSSYTWTIPTGYFGNQLTFTYDHPDAYGRTQTETVTVHCIKTAHSESLLSPASNHQILVEDLKPLNTVTPVIHRQALGGEFTVVTPPGSLTVLRTDVDCNTYPCSTTMATIEYDTRKSPYLESGYAEDESGNVIPMRDGGGVATTPGLADGSPAAVYISPGQIVRSYTVGQTSYDVVRRDIYFYGCYMNQAPHVWLKFKNAVKVVLDVQHDRGFCSATYVERTPSDGAVYPGDAVTVSVLVSGTYTQGSPGSGGVTYGVDECCRVTGAYVVGSATMPGDLLHSSITHVGNATFATVVVTMGDTNSTLHVTYGPRDDVFATVTLQVEPIYKFYPDPDYHVEQLVGGTLGFIKPESSGDTARIQKTKTGQYICESEENPVIAEAVPHKCFRFVRWWPDSVGTYSYNVNRMVPSHRFPVRVDIYDEIDWMNPRITLPVVQSNVTLVAEFEEAPVVDDLVYGGGGSLMYKPEGGQLMYFGCDMRDAGS